MAHAGFSAGRAYLNNYPALIGNIPDDVNRDYTGGSKSEPAGPTTITKKLTMDIAKINNGYQGVIDLDYVYKPTLVNTSSVTDAAQIIITITVTSSFSISVASVTLL